MTGSLARQTGSSFFWKAFEHAGVKGIFLVRLLILARLLAPDDFGLLAISMVAIDVLMRVTDFGMIPALVQRSDIDRNHYNAAWTVGMMRALVVTSIVLFAAPVIARAFAEPRALWIIRAIAVRPLIEAAASIKVAELLRTLQFRPLAFIKLPGALTNTVVSIVLAPHFGVWALVAGTLAGPMAFFLVSYALAPYRPRICFDSASIAPLIRFGRWIFLSGLIAVAGSAVLRLVISRQLGAVELGLYYMGARLAFLPAEVASELVGSVTFPLYARLQSELKKTTRAFQSILTGMSAVLLPVCTLTIVLAPSLVQHILGPGWERTVPVIRILSVVSMVGLLGEAIVPVLKGMGQPYKVVVLEGVQTLLLIALIWTLANRYGIIGAALSWLPAILASQIVGVILVRRLLTAPFSSIASPLLAVVMASVAGGYLAMSIDRIISGLPGLILGGLLGLILMASILWLTDRRFSLGFVKGFSQAFPEIASFMGLSSADRLGQ
ncbi:MAG: oligosaccharide flippase family protein [Planctomycetota bacterium]|jgi:O-antigen/teichoic acid export membrane protein